MLKEKIKGIVKRSAILTKFITYLRTRITTYRYLRHNQMSLCFQGCIVRDIIGKHNQIEIKGGSKLDSLKIRIRGNNNSLVIEENCQFGSKCSIWIEGNDIKVKIGKNCTFTTLCHINAQEDNSIISLGEDCMLSNNIIIRTSDSHPIYDITSKKRINLPAPVMIGDHVWIAPNTKIMKGAVIPNNCIIGSDTTVSKCFEEPNCLIVGRPAKIVRKEVAWTREHLF